MQHLYRLKQAILPRPGESFAAKQFGLLRSAYNGHVKRWLSDDARQTITRAKRRVARILRIPERLQVDPVLPESDLSLSGLVYTTIFNVGDPRKNPGEILSAFLLAFSDRPDVTLVIKLVTNPVRERHELAHLRSLYENLGIEHRCRIVVITDYLDDHEMAGLLRATTYYVNHSFGEGACLPLMHSLAGGRPGLAPDHTAMADYVDDAVAFVTRSTPEPTHWPHDPDRRVETFRARPFWADLHRNFLQSAEVVLSDRARYDRMASAARSRMADRAGRTFVRERLASLLSGLPRFPRRLDWVG
jgi:glycosyltransferase involved in cell wall biosynthesis